MGESDSAMKFRWKLLIFLLIIALGPALMLRTAGIRHLKQVANELTTRIHNLRLTDAQNRFSLLVQGAGELLRASRRHHEWSPDRCLHW